MNLSKIQALQNVTNTQSTASAKRIEQLMELSQMEKLSDAERSMISDSFPTGQNKKLELYMSSGNTATENPDSRGNNFDFRI